MFGRFKTLTCALQPHEFDTALSAVWCWSSCTSAMPSVCLSGAAAAHIVRLYSPSVAEAKWEFVALLPLFDPPRHDTRETVERCLEKGIQVKMITGDQLAIGQETARQLGMGHHMHTSSQLIEVGCLPHRAS